MIPTDMVLPVAFGAAAILTLVSFAIDGIWKRYHR